MNSSIENLNQWGGQFLNFAWPMAWQSGVLIAALLAFDFLFRRQVRASVRYALWLVVLVKLILPPALALPTSPAWWLHLNQPAVLAKPLIQNYTVSYDYVTVAGAFPEHLDRICSAETSDDLGRMVAGFIRCRSARDYWPGCWCVGGRSHGRFRSLGVRVG